MSNSSFIPFMGSSQTVSEGKQAGASSAESLLSEIFSDKAREEFARECKLGMYTNLSSDNLFNHIDLVPKNTGAKVLNLFKSDYEKGKIPSKGVLSIPRILVFLVRTVSSSEPGHITIRLVDSRSGTLHSLEAVDGTQEVSIPINSLPAIVCFSPSYDCPLEVIGNRNRCFGLVTQLDGVSGSNGTVVMSHAYWKADFKSKPNNYKPRKAMCKFVAPHDRLKSMGKQQLIRYIKGISNQAVDIGHLMGEAAFKTDSDIPQVLGVEEESLTPDVSDKRSGKTATANSVAGLAAVQKSTLIRR
nr:movement protein [Bromoviridae sp.]